MRESPPRSGKSRRLRTLTLRARYWHGTVLWVLFMFPLTWWGLPSRYDDLLLFGGEPAWPAQRYAVADKLAQRDSRSAGADTDLDPIGSSAELVDLTATPLQRAEILLRYRIYSRQPDEMITFMALQRMHPRQGDLDPKLYQYGGAYIYLVGSAVAVAALLHMVTLTTLDHYLAQPDLFGQLYLVARFVSLLFGALALLACARLGARAGGRVAGWLALILAATAPAFISAVLEAKPHIASAAATLWTIDFAVSFLTRRNPRALWSMAAAGGLSFSFVLTGFVALLVWPALWLTRRGVALLKPLLLSALAAIGLYLATNAFLVRNALFDRATLSSNVANSTDMYHVGQLAAGFHRTISLLALGTNPPVAITGLIAALFLARRWRQAALLAAAPALGVLLMCALLGAGKPAEFARFLVTPALLLCVAAGWAIARLGARRWRAALAVIILIGISSQTPAYVQAFATDAGRAGESRRRAADYIEVHLGTDESIGLLQEPAPYAVPPLDFAHRRVLLLPPLPPAGLAAGPLPRLLVMTADSLPAAGSFWWTRYYRLVARFPTLAEQPAPLITWANKLTLVFERIDDSSARAVRPEGS